MKIRFVSKWSEVEDVVLVFDGGVEIPAVQASATGRFYFKDGHGRTRTIDVVGSRGEEKYILDAFGEKSMCFNSSGDLIRHLEEETGPAPRGRVVIVDQVGSTFVYASVPHTEGTGE
jgi:hypothetical protein